MRKNALLHTMAGFALTLGLSVAAQAQNNSQNAASQTEQKPAAKSHKVWTSDDMGSLRSPADVYLENEQKKAADDAAAAKLAAENKQAAAGATPVKKPQPPRLSNPKTAQAAEDMIAWEDRDIQSEVEYIAQLKQQLPNETPDRKPRIEKLIQQHEQQLAETRQERAGLAAQKQALEKK